MSPPINTQPASSDPSDACPSDQSTSPCRQDNRTSRAGTRTSSTPHKNYACKYPALRYLVLSQPWHRDPHLPRQSFCPTFGQKRTQDKRHPGLEKHRGPLYWHESLQLLRRRKSTEADKTRRFRFVETVGIAAEITTMLFLRCLCFGVGCGMEKSPSWGNGVQFLLCSEPLLGDFTLPIVAAAAIVESYHSAGLFS
jgi:hypothetical protein